MDLRAAVAFVSQNCGWKVRGLVASERKLVDNYSEICAFVFFWDCLDRRSSLKTHLQFSTHFANISSTKSLPSEKKKKKLNQQSVMKTTLASVEFNRSALIQCLMILFIV